MARIDINDIRKAGHCALGARRWFEAHRLDFRDFMQNGIDEQVLLDTKDQYAFDVVNAKREREGNG
jgi:hypothetical protein